MADDDSLNITITADASQGATAVSDMEARLAALETQFNKSSTASVGLGAGLNDLAAHSLMAARGFEAMGLDADAAAAKIDGLAKVLEEVGTAAPGLLAIGIALAAISASVGFFKDGVKLAGDFESEMISLGTAVKNSGGDWSVMSKQIEDWATMMERATGIGANELVASLNKLVTSGASAKDAEYEVSVAADIMRAKHISLEEAVTAVNGALAGHGRELEKLDPQVKSLVESHASLFTIMQKVESDMSGQAAESTKSYEGHVRSLAGAWDEFKRDVGTWLLPWLESVIDRFDDTVRSINDMSRALSAGHWKNAWDDGTGHGDTAGETAAAQRKRARQLKDQRRLDFNPNMGNEGAGSEGYEPSISRASRDSANYADPTKLDAAASMMKAYAASEAELEAKVKAATSTVAEHAATLVLLAAKASDAKAEVTALTAIVSGDRSAFEAQTTTVKSSYQAYTEAVAATNAYEQSLKGVAKVSQDQKDHLQALKQAQDDAKGAYDDADRTLQKLSSTLKTHNDLLVTARENVVKFGADYTAAMNASAKADADFYAKAADNQAEFMATFNKTNAQKVVAYDKMIAALDQSDVVQAERARELTTKRSEAWEASLDDMAKAYKKWVNDATKETATFIDGVIAKHETLKESLKSIYDQILKNFSETMAKTLIGNGTGPLASLFPGNPLTSAGASQNTYTNGALNVHIKDGSTDFFNKSTGSPTGVASSSTMAVLNTQPPAPGSTTQSAGAKSTATIVAGALQGAAIGSETSGIAGGNSEYSQLGGALGGIIGAALHANPLIGAGIDVVTSLIGGLFGPHETAADQPDLNDPTWGTDLANWQGGGVTVGNNFVTPDSQYNNSNGGTSQSIDIANWVKENQNNLSTLTVAQQGIYQQMLALMGGNPNASAGSIGIASEHQGMVTLTDGQTMSVANFEALISNFNSTVGAAAGGSPIYEIGRSYSDFNLGTVNNTGTSTPSSGGTSTQVGNVTVVVQNPTIVGPSGLNDVAVAIGTAINRATSGTIVGSPSTYAGTGRNLRAANQGSG